MPDVNFEAIKASINAQELIGRTIPLKPSGNHMKGLCPFHAERSPSFAVYKDGYHCFGCGAKGDVIDWVAENEGCTLIEAAQKLGGDDFKMTDKVRQQITDHAEQREREKQEATISARARWERAPKASADNAYLKRKGIEPNIARQEGDNLLVPVFDEAGEVQSVQSIAPDGAKLFHQGAPMKGGRFSFGIAFGRVIVCEGFATGASLSNATTDCVRVGFSINGIQTIVDELLASGGDVAIAADQKGISHILKFAQERGVPVYVPTGEHDDFNDMEQAEGTDAVRIVLNSPPLSSGTDATPSETTLDAANDDTGPANIWNRNAPPALPKGLLPPLIERFAHTRTQLLGADAGGLAMACLAVCSAAIPDTISLKVRRYEDWTEQARLWVVLIGNPSTKKSPLIKAASRAIARMDSDMFRENQKALAKWQADKKDGEEYEKPPEEQMRLDDVNMESAQEVCRHSPKGVLALQDELSAWFGGIERSGGGKGSMKERGFWLRSYNGGDYVVGRIGRGKFIIDNLSVSILGGIQPDALQKIMADSVEDGLIQRFMTVILPKAQVGIDQPMPDVASEYDALVQSLRNIKGPKNVFGPVPLTFDADAQEIQSKLEHEHFNMASALERVSRKFAAHIGKFDGMFPRLCIIWHCIENINQETIPAVITGATAQRCADFLHGYVLQQSKAFYHGLLGMSEDQEIIEDVAGYILAHKVEEVTMRTFARGSTTMRKLTKFNILPICEQMEAMGWIEKIEARGDKFSCKVNPEVHEIFAQKAEDEKQRRAETVANIKKLIEAQK